MKQLEHSNKYAVLANKSHSPALLLSGMARIILAKYIFLK